MIYILLFTLKNFIYNNCLKNKVSCIFTGLYSIIINKNQSWTSEKNLRIIDVNEYIWRLRQIYTNFDFINFDEIEKILSYYINYKY